MTPAQLGHFRPRDRKRHNSWRCSYGRTVKDFHRFAVTVRGVRGDAGVHGVVRGTIPRHAYTHQLEQPCLQGPNAWRGGASYSSSSSSNFGERSVGVLEFCALSELHPATAGLKIAFSAKTQGRSPGLWSIAASRHLTDTSQRSAFKSQTQPAQKQRPRTRYSKRRRISIARSPASWTTVATRVSRR